MRTQRRTRTWTRAQARARARAHTRKGNGREATARPGDEHDTNGATKGADTDHGLRVVNANKMPAVLHGTGHRVDGGARAAPQVKDGGVGPVVRLHPIQQHVNDLAVQRNGARDHVVEHHRHLKTRAGGGEAADWRAGAAATGGAPASTGWLGTRLSLAMGGWEAGGRLRGGGTHFWQAPTALDLPPRGFEWSGCIVRIRVWLRLPHGCHRPLSIVSASRASPGAFALCIPAVAPGCSLALWTL